MLSTRQRRRPMLGARTAAVLAAAVALAVGATWGLQPRPAAAATTGWTLAVATATTGPASLFTASTAGPTAGPAGPLSAGGGPAVAITGNGLTAWATDQTCPDGCQSGAVSAVTLATAGRTATVAIGTTAVDVALAPDDGTVWAIDTSAGRLVGVPTSGGARRSLSVPGALALTITPDGSTAWVGVFTLRGVRQVVPVDLASLTAGTALSVPVVPAALGSSPDGSTVWIAGQAGQTPTAGVVPLRLATRTVGPVIAAGAVEQASGLAVSPDGGTVWVVNTNGNRLDSVLTATATAGTSIALPTIPNGVAVAPDGRTGYVTVGRCFVQVVDLAGGRLGPALAQPAAASGCSSGVAVSPDQAPSASFTSNAAVPGAETRFDGSASSSPVGAVVSWAWSFGDGATAVTTTPQVGHVYANSGPRTVTLTVTNSAGTSTTRAWTGHQAARSGGPAATTTRTVLIPGPADPATPGPVRTSAPSPTTKAPGQPPRRATPAASTTPSGGPTSGPTAPPPPPPGVRTLVADPPLGPAGFVTQVRGAGFPAGATVALTWSPGIGGATVTAGQDGAFLTPLLVLPRDRLGPREVRAAVPTEGRGAGVTSAPFLVVQSAAGPPGSSGSFVFRG